MAYSQNFPAQRPSFMFDAANSGRIPPNMTFTRASTGTFFGTDKVLSSENLVAYSNDISTKTLEGVTATGSQTAPDGGTDAYKLTENSATGFHRFYEIITQPGTAITFSAYFKYIGRQWIRIRLTDGGGSDRFVWFDIQNGVAGTAETGYSNVSITSSGNGYHKVSATLGTSGVGGTKYLVVEATSGDGVSGSSIAGLNADAFAVWGIQVSSTGETVLNETSGSIHREYQTKLQTAASGAARFEHSATDGQSMGCLLESSSTNLFTYSSDASNADWTKTGTTATAEAIGPDGQLSAFAVRETTAGGVHILRQAVTIGSGSVAFSIYAKLLGNTRRMVLREDSTTGAYATFDLSTGTVAASGAGGSGSLEAVGNGFYRCTMVSSPGAGTKNFSAWVVQSTATTYETYTGDGYSGLLLAMPQIEDQSFASSWISTTSSTATRASDSLSVATADIGYTGGDVTVVGEASFLSSTYSSSPQLFDLNDNTSSNKFAIYRSSGANGLFSSLTASGTFYGTTTALGTAVADTDYKFAAALSSSRQASCVNGGSVGEDTSVVLPTINTLDIGNDFNGGAELDGHIKRIALYNEALSDTNLQALTS